ncbi:MAG: hypothetical protein ABIR10_00235 [Dokdonella sp.]
MNDTFFPAMGMNHGDRQAMQCDLNVRTGAGRNRLSDVALALALALIAACARNAVAATPEQLRAWLGCYEIAISTDERPVDTRILRLTDSPVEGTDGAYLAEHSKSAEDEGVMASWWPYNKTSIQLNFGNGSVVWAARLNSFGKSLVGAGAWTTDNGNTVTAFHVSAVKKRCDP